MNLHYVTSSPENLRPEHYRAFISSVEKMRNENHKRSINYTENRFPIHDQTAISLVLSGHECIAFSTIWNRKNFWGPSVYRVLNRGWREASYREKQFSRGDFCKFFSKKMLQGQLNFMKQFRHSYITFISREGDMRKYFRWLSEKISIHFIICNELCLVCPDKSSDSCWHTVAFLREADSLKNPFLRKPFNKTM